MGQSPLVEMQQRAEERSGKIVVSGRYNRKPKRLEDDYDIMVTKDGPKDEGKVVLGTGYNGAVFLARSKRDPSMKFAIKSFHLHGVPKDKKLELETECEIFLTMDHPHVCRLVDVYECEKHMNLVMECMEGGELFARVKEQKRFNERVASHACWQMLLAINYIHSKGIVHRDLKLENFLYESKSGDHLKLIDFGFSKIWEVNTTMNLSCGTLSYVAPEVLAQNYTAQCDMWSFGVIAFILLVGYMPFAGPEDQQKRNIKAGKYNKRPDRWASVSPEATQFIQRLLVVNPAQRLTASQALQEPWIQAHDKPFNEANIACEDSAKALLEFAEASAFRRACMSVMAWSLSNEERAKVRDMFLAMDTGRTGVITLGELKTVLNKHFKVTDEQIMPIFEALDTSNNEEIHYSEFLAAMVSTRIAMHDDLLAATFARFDVDKSGYITRDNLRAVLGDSYQGSDIEQLIFDADTTKDGQISYDEFIAYLKSENACDKHREVALEIVEDQIHKHAQPMDQGDGCQLSYDHQGNFLGLQARSGESERATGSQPQDGSQVVPVPVPTPAPQDKKSRFCVLL